MPTWQPEPRPEWVDAVNAGSVSPIAEVAALPLARDALLAEARATLGIGGGGTDGLRIGGFGDDEFVEPLDVLVAALEDEAELTVVGRWLTRRFVLRLLEVRAQTVAYVAADPGVRDEVIAEPVFVAGAPRTGTTILHALLAQDPRFRVPEGWELLRPVPAAAPRPRSRRRARRASPTGSCAAWRRSRHASTPSTSTAAACTRSACRRCRSCSAPRSSPPATTCRRT